MKFTLTIALFIINTTSAMAKEIKTQILINASPEKVWQFLTDFEKYDQWNPFIQSLDGVVAVGETKEPLPSFTRKNLKGFSFPYSILRTPLKVLPHSMKN